MRSMSQEQSADKRWPDVLARHAATWLPHVVIIGCHLILFWTMLCGQKAPGFRDTAYLYYPLFEWTDRQWEEGELPLWNPNDNFGVPVVEDCSTSVFYPLKSVFWLRALPYPTRFGLFLFLHGLLAAYGAYWCALKMRCNRYGATIAGLSYSLGGAVLFQVCNVIFYVSAAWLPWSIGFWWLLFEGGRKRMIPWVAIPGVAVCLAMMVLGGDPQTAYHSAILGFVILVFAKSVGRGHKRSGLFGVYVNRSLQFACTGALALGLCAVQWLPTAEYSRLSERSREPGQPPRTVWEIPGYCIDTESETKVSDISSGLLGKPTPETHHHDIYLFSQPPWTMLQLAWPNFTGRWMPVFRRWTLPFEGTPKIWTASIFLGVIPLILSLTGIRIRWKNLRWASRDRRQAILTWVAMIFGLGSFGVYGLVWMLNFLTQSLMGYEWLETWGDGVGGIYWMFVTFLPKYISFRYPAKLVVVAVLAISLLSGLQMRGKVLRNSHALWLMGISVSVLTFVLLALVLIPSVGFFENLQMIGNHESMGPFDPGGCYRDVVTGLASTMVVIVFLLACVHFFRKRVATLRQVYMSIVVVVATELLIANSWLLLPVDVEYFASGIQTDSLVSSDHNSLEMKGRWIRFPVDEYYCSSWAENASESRMGEVVAWQCETFYPRMHLRDNTKLIGVTSTIQPSWKKMQFTETFESNYMDWVNWFGTVQDDPIGRSIEGVIVSPVNPLSQNVDMELCYQLDDGVRFYRNPNFDGTIAFDSNGNSLKHRWVSCRKLDVDFEVDSTHVQNEQSFMVAVAWGPGWKGQLRGCTADGQELIREIAYDDVSPQLPWMSKVDVGDLPPGEYRMSLEYFPRSLKIGGWVSGTTWIGVLIMSGFAVIRRRKRR